MCLSPRPCQAGGGSDLGLGYELGLSVYCPVMPLPQSSLNPTRTYPDVLLYILSFPCFRVARIRWTGGRSAGGCQAVEVHQASA